MWSDSNDEDDAFDERDDEEELLHQIFGYDTDYNCKEDEDNNTLEFSGAREGRRWGAKRAREENHEIESSPEKYSEADSLRVSQSQERVAMLAAFASGILCSWDDDCELRATDPSLVVLEGRTFARDRELAANEMSRMVGLLLAPSKKHQSFQYI